MPALQTVHITARMRTLPRDNFELIGVELRFRPGGDVERFRHAAEMARRKARARGGDGWRGFAPAHRRESARCVVAHGTVSWNGSCLCWTPIRCCRANSRAARQGKSQATLAGRGAWLAAKLRLHVARQAEGDFTNDWVKNKSILESDHTLRVPLRRRHQPAHRIADAGASVAGRTSRFSRSPVFVTTNRCRPICSPWRCPRMSAGWVPRKIFRSSGVIPATPREAALAFLEGAANRDWQRVASVYQVDERLQEIHRRHSGAIRRRSLPIGHVSRAGSCLTKSACPEAKPRSTTSRCATTIHRNVSSWTAVLVC